MEDNKLFQALSYLGVLVFIPMFAKQDDEDVKFHVNQGLLLFVTELAAWALSYTPFIKFAAWVVGVLCFAYSIIGIVNVINGDKKIVPIIGKYNLLGKVMELLKK